MLMHAHELRLKISKGLAILQSSGAASAARAARIRDAAGMRAHLLAGSEFWSLRDLEDVSKGAFSDLPSWLEAVDVQVTHSLSEVVFSGQAGAAVPPGPKPCLDG